MSEQYEEGDRLEKVFCSDIIKNYLTVHNSPVQIKVRYMDVSITVDGYPILIIEVKKRGWHGCF